MKTLYDVSFWGLHIVALGLFILGYYLQYSNACLSNLNHLQYSVYISRGAGLTLSVFMTLNLAVNLKHTLRLLRRLRLLQLYKWYPQNSLYIHRHLAGIVIVYSLIHSMAHYFNFYTAENLGIARMYFIHYHTYGGITGHIMVVSMLFTAYFATKYYRKYNFRMFEIFHQFYWFMSLAFIFHSRGCFVRQNDSKCLPYFSMYHFSATMILFILEKSTVLFTKPLYIKDIMYYKNCLKLILSEKENTLPWQYLNFKCNPGEYIKVKIPIISSEFHPFTVTSHQRFDNDIVLYIKQVGDWTCKLRDFIEDNDINTIEISYQGPFSSPCDTYMLYDAVLLVATGIGITPFISILKDYYLYHHENPGYLNRKLELIWVVNNKGDIDIVKDLIKKMTTLPESYFRFKMFLTEKFEENGWNLATSSMNRVVDMRELGVELYYGRPDFYKVIDDFKAYTNVKNSGIFCCANKEAKTKLRGVVVNTTNKSRQLTFIEEPFL